MATLDAATDVILRDGSTLRLRPPRAADSGALVAFLEELSEASRYRRFHGFRRPGEELVAGWLEPDWQERGALLGTLAGGAESERVVAVGNYARLRDASTAEAAFVVADDYQGRGVGTRLLEQLAARAAPVGIARFVASVLAENRPMLEVFQRAGFAVERELEGGEVEVAFPIAPTPSYVERVESRDHVAVVASLRPFFEPRSVAVLGASSRRGTIGGELFRNILRADFAGAAFPINPRGTPVAGVYAYRAVEEIPGPVELAVLCVPAAAVLDAAASALRAGCKALVCVTAGFAEVGSEGAERQRELLALVRSHGARLTGPNCLGIAVSAPRLNATFASRRAQQGTIGFSSQSGALGLALLEAAQARGLGLSSFVSIGNKADVSSNDLLEWWEEDSATEVVLLYVESFGNPRKFGRLARRVARRKPVLALKSGTSQAGQRAAASHTAALAGSEAAVDALFRHAGVIRAASLDELVDVATLLSRQPEPKGKRVGILTNAGGLGILCADACEAAGLELPPPGEETRRALAELLPEEASVANPVDMLGSATADLYGRALPLLTADPQLDAVISLFVPAVTATADEVAEAVAGVGRGDKPLLAVVLSAEGVPPALREGAAAFVSVEAAARALGRAAERAAWLRRPQGRPVELEVDRDGARALVERLLGDRDDAWLEPAEARELLGCYGVPLVPERRVDSADEAVAAAAELGFPAVVKTAAAGAHKTETGGVAVDLAAERQVREAAGRIGGPLLVQPMVAGGVELLAGVVADPVFGPLVAFGAGGVYTELFGQAAFRIAPLTDLDAAELVQTGAAGTLVRGFRGKPAADASCLEDLLLRLSALADEVPELAELDLNPVIALPDRCVAVDAR
ncbi:MAG TPA: GNAT family N-acetyltransferase, partial [Gaiellaceae bacterium]|nr:GNAT family N-acetyltransferase [Gaiellaceae bacterium]